MNLDKAVFTAGFFIIALLIGLIVCNAVPEAPKVLPTEELPEGCIERCAFMLDRHDPVYVECLSRCDLHKKEEHSDVQGVSAACILYPHLCLIGSMFPDGLF